MKKVDIYAVLMGRNNSEVRRVKFHTALMDEDGWISGAVYRKMRDRVWKDNPFPGKGRYWTLVTADGRRVNGYVHPLAHRVRFE